MKTKIFVAYHKEAELIENDVLTPIHVGRTLYTSKWFESNMMGDNTGDNISDKNDRYCELTAQYFAWKNYDKIGNPDYIGFFHYRRIFNFNETSSFQLNPKGEIVYYSSTIDESFYRRYGLESDNINNILENYDVVLPAPTNLEKLYSKNVYQQYASHHNIKFYDIALKVLLKHYPEFKPAIEIYNQSKYAYFTNSYIMKKEVFMEYAQWLFNILFEAESIINATSKENKARLMGYISERLLGIYIIYLKQKKYNIKELLPVFIDSTIPVVFSCNNKYTTPLCTTITSILKNANPNDEFKFYILNTKENLNYINKRLISKFNQKKASITYVTLDNQKELFKKMPLTNSCSHVSVETYYRLLLASLFPQYEKILYLDCDTIVLSPLRQLYSTNISEYYCAGVKDILAEDSTKRLDLEKYFNAGVLLVNLERWRRDNIEQKLFDYVKENYDKIVWVDQDVLNVVLQDGIHYLDPRWNAQIGEYEHCYTTGFNKIGENAFILHYIGNNKPWMPLSKNPFKKVYMNYLHMAGWECSIIKYSTYCFGYYICMSISILDNLRKFLIRYDRRNKKFVFFKQFSI